VLIVGAGGGSGWLGGANVGVEGSGGTGGDEGCWTGGLGVDGNC